MESRLDHAAVKNLVRASRLEQLNGHLASVLMHLQTIFAVGISDARCGYSVSILLDRIELDSIPLIRKIFTKQSHTCNMAEALLHHPMMIRTPWNRLACKAAPRLMKRTK